MGENKIKHVLTSTQTGIRQNHESNRSGALGPAHRGYAYQDLVTAYLFIVCLIGRQERVVVDRKVVEDDRFDDVEVWSSGWCTRRQIKSSEDRDRVICFADFNGHRSSLRFDRLVRTFTSAGQNPASEYRLCATWQSAAAPDPLVDLLIPDGSSTTFTEYPTLSFRLDPDKVWPEKGEPVFASLLPSEDGSETPTRLEVIAFCERFVIEVGLPIASMDLYVPGELERLLLVLLSEEIGIGRYPNAERRAEDVAALAIHLAMKARILGATLDSAAIIHGLHLQTDFGRVAQAFPLDRSILQDRTQVRAKLRTAFSAGGVHFVLAGPGFGKSWILTQLAEEMSADGAVVARHYCFLEPGDENVERRVTTDVFFGNLIGELSDACGDRVERLPVTFAAGISELENLLKHVVDEGLEAVVIVDGLDHIARVVDSSPGLTESETDIVERMATLKLPEKITLVIGSQPGMHLAPLRQAFGNRLQEHVLDPWCEADVQSLAEKLGVVSALEKAGLADDDRRLRVLDALAFRSEGNPLYVRYLSSGLSTGLGNGVISDPVEWLDTSPAIQGDIAGYYRHLYDTVSKESQVIADILGVLDFSVTEAELKELVGPMLGDWVPSALVALMPVLTHATAQGGLRIFHESFRRFMSQELQRQGRNLSNVLRPVIAWLENREFFKDAKSYRFMLAAMRRAGREGDILHIVSRTFVRDSVVYGHPHDAIERNLYLASDVAAATTNWPVLVRCAELSRQLAAGFDIGQNDWPEYWKTFQAMHGAGALAERLLFDGRPTLNRDLGLLACESVDIAGIAAPWSEYLELPVPETDQRYSSDIDPLWRLSEDERVGLAAIRGRLRLAQFTRIVRRVYANLCSVEEVSAEFLRRLAKLLAGEISFDLVERMIRRVAPAASRRYVIPEEFGCALLLGLSDAAKAAGNSTRSLEYATSALRFADGPEKAIWCVESGAPIEAALRFAQPPDDIDIALDGSSHIVNATSVRQWVASIRLNARDHSASAVLLDQRQRAEGAGWYRCWLRFVIALAGCEAAAARGEEYSISEAFSELVVDTRPFVGEPRACDLYSIQRVIEESLSRGLKLVRRSGEWREVIDAVTRAKEMTATRLDREDGGPISTGTYFAILLPFAENPEVEGIVRATMERELAEEEAKGTYYSNHAEYRMRLARLCSRSNDEAAAHVHWQVACSYLLGYGFHKDIALFDVIRSARVLRHCSESVALDALARLQPLLSAALRHTDGRETKHTPNSWFKSLIEVNIVRAIELLCREFIREHGYASWMARAGVEDVLRTLKDSASPRLLDALWDTLLTEFEYQSSGREIAKDRFAPIARIREENATLAAERFDRLCCGVFNDANHNQEGAVLQVEEFSQLHSLQIPWTSAPEKVVDKNANMRVSASPRLQDWIDCEPLTSFGNANYVEVLVALRVMSRRPFNAMRIDRELVVPLSYVLTELADNGAENEAHRLIFFLVRESQSWSWEKNHPIGRLAECLDNAGYARLAAVCHALSYTSSRGGRGWLLFGDQSQAAGLRRALVLDGALARETLASETAFKLRMGGYSGIAQHLVEQISDWGDLDLARAAWEETFSIMEMRLPLPGNHTVFEPLDEKSEIIWSVDEALAVLLLTQIGNPVIPRKVAALGSFTRLLQEQPMLFHRPLVWLLSRDATVAHVQVVMQVLLEVPADIGPLLRVLHDDLVGYANGDAWSLSFLAQQLLERSGHRTHVVRSRALNLESQYNHRGMMIAMFGGMDKFLPQLEEVWPGIGNIVANRIAKPSIDHEVFKHYEQERLELATGHRNDSRLRAQVLSWSSEVLISVLDDVLMGLGNVLWRRGEWQPEAEYFVLGSLLPQLWAHLGIDASRVPRPRWPLAKDAKDQLGDILIVPAEDPNYGGWIRLAFTERQFYRGDDRDYLAPDKVAVVSAGIVVAKMDGTVPHGASPVPPRDAGEWWEDVSNSEASDLRMRPQLAGISAESDLFGSMRMLVPPLWLRHFARLQTPNYGEPLCWRDLNGDVAVLMRSWRVRGSDLRVESYATIGADLLIRPDLLGTLSAMAKGPLKDLQITHTHELDET